MDIREAKAFAKKISDKRNELIPTAMIEVAAEQIFHEFKDYHNEEVQIALEDVYLPYYPKEFKKFINDIKETIAFNRLPAKEKEAERQKALEKWYAGLKRLYPDYEPQQADRSVEDILGD